jgi:hypothetical protein
MIANIVDERKKPFIWRGIDALIEPAHLNNRRSVRGGNDKAPEDCHFASELLTNVTVEDAIEAANKHRGHVTMYLRDVKND